MKETGIIMSGDHPQKVLDGLKTMTRRTAGLDKINENPDLWERPFYDSDMGGWGFWQKYTGDVKYIKCPYGQVGDRLYIKETHYKYGYWLIDKVNLTKAGKPKFIFNPLYFTSSFSDNPPEVIVTDRLMEGWFKRPSMFMFKKDARIWTEITGLRAERVQDISWRDCKREGVVTEKMTFSVFAEPWRDAFERLWNSLNAKRGHGWDRNEWVWVILLKLMEAIRK